MDDGVLRALQLRAPGLPRLWIELFPKRGRDGRQGSVERQLPERMEPALEVVVEHRAFAHSREVAPEQPQGCRRFTVTEERRRRPIGRTPDLPDAPRPGSACELALRRVLGDRGDVDQVPEDVEGSAVLP